MASQKNWCLTPINPLSDEERKRKRERGAFFGSIHHTLTHLVLADKMWLQRFAAQGTAFAALSPALLALPDGSDYTSDLHPDWLDLKRTREALDTAIEAWIAEMPPQFVLGTMRYANTKGVARAPGLAGNNAFFQPPDTSPRPGDDAADAGGRGCRRDRPDCAGLTRTVFSSRHPICR
ncbi:MAG: DinB family protein [Polaromonas sp.]|nr:DinB family protein [Polaromonas sp.]